MAKKTPGTLHDAFLDELKDEALLTGRGRFADDVSALKAFEQGRQLNSKSFGLNRCSHRWTKPPKGSTVTASLAFSKKAAP